MDEQSLTLLLSRDGGALLAVFLMWQLMVKPALDRIEATMSKGFQDLKDRLPPPSYRHDPPAPPASAAAPTVPVRGSVPLAAA